MSDRTHADSRPPVGAAGPIVHTVQIGQTLTSIARLYGVDLWTLARVNGIVNLTESTWASG